MNWCVDFFQKIFSENILYRMVLALKDMMMEAVQMKNNVPYAVSNSTLKQD